MLRVGNLKVLMILIVMLLSVYLALPTFVLDGNGSGDRAGQELQQKHVAWSKYLLSTKVNLGLDLLGGVSLVLEVDDEVYYNDFLQNAANTIEQRLKKNNIKSAHISVNDKKLIFIVDDASEIKQITQIANESAKEIFGSKNYELNQKDQELNLVMDEKFQTTVQDKLLQQSMKILQRRVDESGTKEIDLQRQGHNQILLQVPGVYDTDSLKRILGKTAKLSFHLVHNDGNTDLRYGRISIGVKALPMDEFAGRRGGKSAKKSKDKQESPVHGEVVIQNSTMVPVRIQALMSGEMLTDAQATTNNMGAYVVQFKLSDAGAKIFADITARNKGRALAIVMDNKVISAPVINEAIPSGSGVISGNFDAESANELAVLLRSGALPTQLKIVEERTVGPTLGQASIDAGATSVSIGCCAVMVFMLVFYGYWGILANVALVFNMSMIIGILGVFGATLTMPGVAGIALTLGMAVDANVLIFERMREEFNKGRGLIASIDGGYKMAMTTILDSNITTIAAALILYVFGSAAVKGFAVTLSIGILCSMFTAVTLTKVLAGVWYRYYKPKALGL